METAKVDIRKLQLLNDRINQCIDALNQVRLSVHGLSHSNPLTQGATAGIGYGGPLPFAAQTGAIPQTFVPGLSHTGAQVPFATPYSLSPFVPPFTPFIGQQPFIGQAPWGMPYAQVGGLSHTSETLGAWNDPSIAFRVAQTFPYAQLPLPPVVSLY